MKEDNRKLRETSEEILDEIDRENDMKDEDIASGCVELEALHRMNLRKIRIESQKENAEGVSEAKAS